MVTLWHLAAGVFALLLVIEMTVIGFAWLADALDL